MLVRITEGTLVIISEISGFISIYISLHDKLISFEHTFLDYSYRIIALLLIFGIVHYVIGYILLISTNLSKELNETEGITGYFMLSYFITSIYLVLILLLNKETISKFVISGYVGVIISYILNLKILFKIIRNKSLIKISSEDEGGFIRIIIAAFIVVFMIIIDLYLATCLISIVNPGSFSNNPNLFDLFYFTIATFTSIGYGDIIPISQGAKILVIIISITSVLCLTVFLGSLYSIKDRQ